MNKVKKPNIFDFATNELSQDAFLCYLLSYSKKKYKDFYPAEYKFARKVLNEILIECFKGEEIPKVKTLEIKKQYYNIDVLLIINENIEKKEGIYIIIEDKTYTTEHSEQMDRYSKKLKEIKKISEEQIKTLYFKTGDESHKQLENSEFKKNNIMRDRILKFYYGEKDNLLYEGSNLIIQEYFEKLKEMDDDIEDYKNVDLKKETFTWNQMLGFYKALDDIFYNYHGKKWFYNSEKDLESDYGYVSNPNGGFLCYNFAPGLDFGKTAYYLQIEHINVKQEENGSRNTKWSKEKVPYNTMTLVIKVYSEDRDINLLYKGLEMLKSKKELEEKFENGIFLKPNRYTKGTFMTMLLINDYIELNENNTINVDKTAKNIIGYLELLKSLSEDLKKL